MTYRKLPTPANSVGEARETGTGVTQETGSTLSALAREVGLSVFVSEA